MCSIDGADILASKALVVFTLNMDEEGIYAYRNASPADW